MPVFGETANTTVTRKTGEEKKAWESGEWVGNWNHVIAGAGGWECGRATEGTHECQQRKDAD